jgi:hypothetical protein
MEAAIGREALRRYAQPATQSRKDHGHLDRIAWLARNADEAGLDELLAIIEAHEGEIRFAARVAFRVASRRVGLTEPRRARQVDFADEIADSERE